MLAALLVIGLGGTAALWIYDKGRGLTGAYADDAREQLGQYKEQLESVITERDRFSSMANAAESQLNIEKSAQKQLVVQVKTLEAENTRLKEDLAFFESLLPNATGPQGIAIRRDEGGYAGAQSIAIQAISYARRRWTAFCWFDATCHHYAAQRQKCYDDFSGRDAC